MTFTSIQTEVLERLNLTSTTASARVGRTINEKYREMLSSVGLVTSVRGTVTANTAVGVRTLTFNNVEKLYTVFNAALTPPQVLTEITFDEMRNLPVSTGDPARMYAVQTVGASTVIIILGSIPASIYTLSADAEATIADLSGTGVPAFPAKFHNALVYGAMVPELQKLEKYDLAAVQENKFQQRISELRLQIAMSGYLDIVQGKTAQIRLGVGLVS